MTSHSILALTLYKIFILQKFLLYFDGTGRDLLTGIRSLGPWGILCKGSNAKDQIILICIIIKVPH